MFENTFKNKKVLVTGHTGFKGSWLCVWLKMMGADVMGVSLDPPTKPSNYEVIGLKNLINEKILDIREQIEIKKTINSFKPDFLFHLAAQPLVKKSYDNPEETFSINMIGTLNILEALRELKNKCSVILITSDKSYKNNEWVWGYKETDVLGGKDPYSASKGATEIIIKSYVESFFKNQDLISIGVARAGNVIGGGDWARDRIVPDCIKAWGKNEKVIVRNPNSTRPWQHVLEPLSGYLLFARNLEINSSLHGEPFNFGPDPYSNYSVLDLIIEMSKYWKNINWEIHDDNSNANYEAGLLKLNCDKASFYLNWKSTLSFAETIQFTADWYKKFYENKSLMFETTCKQIRSYQDLFVSRNI